MSPVIEQKSIGALVEAINAEACVLETSMDEQPLELCYVEGPIDEQKPSHLVSAINAEAGVLQTSMEEEPIELCYVEGPVDEQKPSHPVSSINAEAAVLEASMEEEQIELCYVEGPVDEQKPSHPVSAINAKAGVLETSMEEEPIELCYVEGPVDEQKPNHPVSAITAEAAVLEASMEEEPIELCYVEGPVDEQKTSHLVSYCNGDLQGKSSSDISSAGEISFAADVHKGISNSKLPSSTSNPAAASITNGDHMVKGSVDLSQDGKSYDIVETDDSNAGAFVLTFGSFTLLLNNNVNVSDGSESDLSDTTAKTLSLSLDDAKVIIEPDNTSEGVSSLKSETNNSSDSTMVSEEVEEPVVDVQTISSDAVSVDEVEKEVSPLNYLIRVPRYYDENLKDNIRLAQIRVDEETRCRDAIRIEMQSMRATCKEYGNDFNAAVSQEKVARDLHRSKHQEIESMQYVIDIEDIDAKIRNMEHAIQHESLSLRDEKNFILDIKRLKHTREKLSSSLGTRDEIQQGLDRKECLKSLKKEADELRANLLKAEAITKASKSKYYEETKRFDELHARLRAANDTQQEAYSQLLSLKKQSFEKHKHFYQNKDDFNRANDLASKGDKEALQSFCTNQVEKFMNLWNNDDEFRKEYVRCNARSTLRRLGPLHGLAFIPNEKPGAVNGRGEQDQPGAKIVEQKTQTSKSEKPLTSILTSSVPTTASSTDKTEEAVKRRKEEDDVARKAEQFRKEEEMAKLREQRRLEEKDKFEEALERKRRKAEKAHAREAERAMKEAEEKEKKREKRAKKKERQKVAAETGDTCITDDAISAPTTSETPKESENRDKAVAVMERTQKASSQFTKHTTKAKSIPPVLRNRRKLRMQTWIRVLVICLIIYALFLIGNCNLSLDYSL